MTDQEFNTGTLPGTNSVPTPVSTKSTAAAEFVSTALPTNNQE